MVVLRVVVDGQQNRGGDKPNYFYCPIWDDDLETPLVQKLDEIAKFCGFDPHPGMQLSVGSAADPSKKTPIRDGDSVASLELIHGSILVLHPGSAQQNAGSAEPPEPTEDYATQTAPQYQPDPQETGAGGYDDDARLGEGQLDQELDQDDAYYRLETVDEEVYEVLLRSEGYLQEVFQYYALMSLPHDRVSYLDFRRFVRDFRVLTLISMSECADVTKATIGVESTSELLIEYPEFILTLEAIAMIGYARHPYGEMQLTSEDKMSRLLVLMVGSEGSRRVENSLSSGQSLRRWIAPLFDEDEEADYEPSMSVFDEDDTRERLKQIFHFYAAFNESSSMETMRNDQFRMFCRQCGFITPREGEKNERGLIGNAVTPADVDVIYAQAVKHEQMREERKGPASVLEAYMNFDAFLEGLVMIAPRVKTDVTSLEEAVREMLRDNVYINASCTAEPIQEPEADRETLILFRRAEKPLRLIFDQYAKLRTGHTVLHYRYMTMEAFMKFARDFRIFPMWLSKPELAEVFRSVCVNNNVETRLGRKKGQVQKAKKQLLFQFPEYVDALAMCALKALSKEPYCEQYLTNAAKVEVFLTQMEACEAKQELKIPMLIRPTKK